MNSDVSSQSKYVEGGGKVTHQSPSHLLRRVPRDNSNGSESGLGACRKDDCLAVTPVQSIFYRPIGPSTTQCNPPCYISCHQEDQYEERHEINLGGINFQLWMLNMDRKKANKKGANLPRISGEIDSRFHGK